MHKHIDSLDSSETAAPHTDKGEIRVLLVVQDAEARKRYLQALAAYDVTVFVSASYHDFDQDIGNQTFHGLLLDIPTKMRAIKDDRTYVYSLVERFPVAHLRIDESRDFVNCFHPGRKSGEKLSDFINNHCRTSIPQKIRVSVRREILLPVLVYRHERVRRPERAITRDISTCGCFIISTRKWKLDADILIHLQCLGDIPLIRAKIRKIVEWGQVGLTPGIGVQFLDLTHEQLFEIRKKIIPPPV